MTGYVWVGNRPARCGSVGLGLPALQALQEAQVDQHVDQRIVVGDGLTVAEMGSLDAQRHRLRVDALDSAALTVEALVEFAVAVERIAQARADAGGHHGGAATAL